MKFLKEYVLVIIFTLFASISLLLGTIAGFIAWVFIPPIAQIFTKDGVEFTKILLENYSNKLKNYK